MQDKMRPKADRLQFLDTTVVQATKLRATLEEMAESPNPVVAARANPLLQRLQNTADDLRITRAFLAGVDAAALSPIAAADARELDELGAMLDEGTKASALANASLVFLGQAVNAAARVGQILDERKKPHVRTTTSGPQGT